MSKLLPADTTKLSNLRVAASASFNEDEVSALGELFGALMRGGDVRAMAKSKALARVAGKLPVMRAAIERQKERRAAYEAANPKSP